MESRIKLFGHPIHPVLVVYPLGLLSTALIFDILYLIFGNTAFPAVSFWLITAGIIGGLLAAVFGFAEWLVIPSGTRAKNIGMWHGLGNATIVVLFIISWLLRRGVPGNIPSLAAIIPAALAVGLALVTGWLGGELVYRLDVGPDVGANLNAPSSLSDQPANRAGGGRAAP